MRTHVKVIRNGTGALIAYVDVENFDLITEAAGPCCSAQTITLSVDEARKLMEFFAKHIPAMESGQKA